MRKFAAIISASTLLSTQAQSIQNPGFESNCAFDMTGWNWFCSSPDFYHSDGHNSCYSLALPTSDGFSPCFSTGQLIGVHTLMSGVQAGMPYQLSLFENMGPNMSSDCGMFAVSAGQTPAYFGDGGALLDIWPVGLSNPGVWIQDLFNFTIPVQYTGMDFYFFIEDSAAPDIEPGMKLFDDIAITDLNTGISGGTSTTLHAYPDPAEDELRVDLPDAPTHVIVIDATGRTHALQNFQHTGHTLQVDVGSIPPGLCVMLLNTASGLRTLRFIKT